MKPLNRMLIVLALCLFASVAQAAPEWVEYHDRNAINHGIESDSLKAKGFRPLSLSVYGSPTSPSFAAVWVKRTGPEWKLFHSLTLGQFQTKLTEEKAAGFRLSMITSTGTGPNARFAGMWEKNANLTAIYALTAPEFDKENLTQKKAGKMLRWATDFGPAGTPLYIGVWEKNPKKVAWNVGHNLTAEMDQQWFDAQTAQWARPAFSTRTTSGRYISLYRDDDIGDWIARGELTSAAYETELASLKAKGYFPLCVQAGGQGPGVRFAAIFAKSDQPAARVWSTPAGQAVPALANFDNVVRSQMMANAVRSGALAVTRNGKLVFARGYTYAEPGYPKTKATSMFRIASCSKPVTSIAIHQLIEKGSLKLSDQVQDLLDTKPIGGTMDPNYTDIKVWHLLSHLGGRYHGPDLPDHFLVRDAAKKKLPVSKSDIAAYMAGQPLGYDPDPGPKPWNFDHYSNLGFLLLGKIIETKTGQPYTQSVHNTVWEPLGVTRPRSARSLVSEAWPGEVRYHDRSDNETDLRVAPSVVHDDGRLVPLAYGGENYQTFDAFGGWVVAAPDYAKLLASFDLADNPLFTKAGTVTTMWSNPTGYATSNPELLRGWFAETLSPAVTEYKHGGGTPGVSTLILHRTDGISIVAFFNGPIGGIGGLLNQTASSIAENAWPTHDLFPTTDIPSFPKYTLAPQQKLVKAFSAKQVTFPEIVTPRKPAPRKTTIPVAGLK